MIWARTSGSASLSAAASAGTARALPSSASELAACGCTPASVILEQPDQAVDGRLGWRLLRADDRLATRARHSSDGCRNMAAAPRKMALDSSSVRKKTVDWAHERLLLRKQHQRRTPSRARSPDGDRWGARRVTGFVRARTPPAGERRRSASFSAAVSRRSRAGRESGRARTRPARARRRWRPSAR